MRIFLTVFCSAIFFFGILRSVKGQVTWITQDSIDRNNPWLTEAGGYTGKNDKMRPYKMASCKASLEKNELVSMMDTNTAVVHVSFNCFCADGYLIDMKVILYSKTETYSSITDKTGDCDFMHIRPGLYKLSLEYKYVRKFRPIKVEVKSGAIYEWKVNLCDK